MSITPDQFADSANEAFAKLEATAKRLDEALIDEDGKDRIDALKAEVKDLGQFVATQKAGQAEAEKQSAIDELRVELDDIKKQVRTPSKAHLISGGRDDADVDVDAFFRNLASATNPRTPSNVKAQAEANLAAMGSTWQDVPGASKATLGETDANGGYAAPRSVVASLTTVANVRNPYRSLLTVVTGILGPTVEIPHLGLLPTRAAIVARGAQKPLQDMSLTNYTATFYTLAQIHDAANQWLRQTSGRGEQIIRQRLGEAMAAGEAWYILNGTGSSQPKGLLTSLGASGTYVTTHAGAQTTIAGNIATGIAKAAGALAGRNRTPTGVVMNSSDFWIALASGADTAGFFISPTGTADVNAVGAGVDGSPAIRLWGFPVYADANMPSESAVIGDWKSAELYLGDGYRIDTSTEAYDRWDKNLTGFRAEEEMAFNADPYVASGLFQRLVDTIT